jgi:uncharacterized membrane protein YbaN (DUF454 family)
VSQKKLALFLLAAVVLILALGFMHSFSAASVPAAPSFLFGEIAIAERSSDEYYPAIAYNSIHNEYLVVWENLWPGGSEDIYAQRISSTGQLLSWFAVSSSSHNQSMTVTWWFGLTIIMATAAIGTFMGVSSHGVDRTLG